eukprot:760801-Amorphochlora_amoeboformis.AAC.2
MLLPHPRPSTPQGSQIKPLIRDLASLFRVTDGFGRKRPKWTCNLFLLAHVGIRPEIHDILASTLPGNAPTARTATCKCHGRPMKGLRPVEGVFIRPLDP